MIKIIGIAALCIIWYLIIGAFVSAGLLKWTEEDLDDEDATLRVVLMIFWPFALIYILFIALGSVLSMLPTGAYNLMNKSKKEKKPKKTVTITQPEYKNIAMTNIEDYPLPAWYCDENGEVKREDNTITTAYKKMGGNAENLEIMKVIDEAVDGCEKKYGIKVKEVTDIFSDWNGRGTYIDFVADNKKTYCLEIPVLIKDWQQGRELLSWYAMFKK